MVNNMIPDITRKLQELIAGGITTEAHVVYLVAQIRKLLEDLNADQYQHLKFHCDWPLHTKLDRSAAQRILVHFDAANISLRDGIELANLSVSLRQEINQISKMDLFRRELHDFLQQHSLPQIDVGQNGWTKFLLLYAKVIEDCPLEIKSRNSASSIERVTVKVELANKLAGDQMFYKISWIVLDKNGKTGDIFVLNSFSIEPE
jgi:hypothetical protein